MAPQAPDRLSGSAGAAIPGSATARLPIVVSIVFTIAMVLALAAYSLWQSREHLHRDAANQAGNLAQVLERYVYTSIHETDLALQVSAEEYRQAVVLGQGRGESYSVFLDRLSKRVPHILRMYATDATGRVNHGRDVDPARPVNIADRPFFQASGDAGLAITPPVLGRLSQQWVLPMARRLEAGDGRFAGVVYAGVAASHFSDLFASLQAGRHAAISLFDAQAGIYIRHPEPNGSGSAIGVKIASAEFTALWRAGRKSATYRAKSSVDGIWRTFSYRQVGNYPVYVMVGLAEEDYLAPWKRQVAVTAGFLAVLGLLMVVLFRSLARSRKAQHRAYLELAEGQEKLRASEDRFRTLFEGAPVGQLLIEPGSLRVLQCNQAAADIHGYSSEELCQLRVWDFDVGLDAEKVEAVQQRLMGGERRVQFETRVRRKNGELRDLAVRAVLFPSADGMRVYATHIDITDRKRIEQDLRVAAIAFDAQVGIVVTDARNVILRVNQSFLETTGYSAEEIVGQTPRLLKSGRHDEVFYRGMWASLEQAGVWQGEIWDRRKNGEIYPKWMVISAVKGDDGLVSHYVSTQTDITERKAAENEIRHLAFYDPLTGLPNRRLLLDRLHQALLTSSRIGRQGALLFIDLDNFKTLNDTLGHDMGDRLLQQAGERLSSCVREGDTVARLGGDEFVVLLENLSEAINEAANQAEAVGEKIRSALNLGYLLAGHDYHSTPSIGVALFGDQRESMETLLKQADLAMYQAKAGGRNTLRFFDPAVQAEVTARVALEKDLRQAVHEGQLLLHYQAQVDAAGRLTGAEVLVRWRHPGRGLVFPNDFIPLAEETGLILPLGNWVLESACVQLARWADRADAAPLALAVNVSGHQLRQADFVDQVLGILAQTGADPRRLKLELTESLFMVDVEDAITKMVALNERGVGFALDDFGTGYSSLSCLKRLPLKRLKIDRSFVTDILTDANDAAIARTIVALARTLGLDVIAEGVETEAQRDFLAGIGCLDYQGYLFSRPLPLEEFEQLLAEGGKR